ncbi:DUF3883 domain-containing protein [Alistipes sp.]|uniref:protein NO VEIN domain-containing protein n=1 Tax=Alistipes sp. TaxID=1872444 RepID=UPI0011DD6835|nr:DUF3883 domain-containing protein [Alistipes sp.]
MFFRAHGEGRIGYKQLTDADLGRGATTHQTHIGLFDDILTFLYDQRVEEEAMLIFNNNSDMVDCFFDRIENPDGSFRSPKIRKGNAVSVVTVIRDWAISEPMDYRWYLMWFGLESGMVVFYLFNDHMPDFEAVSRIVDLSQARVKGRITSGDSRFGKLMNYLENIVNRSSAEILEQLEVASQTGASRTFKPFDIEKAGELFRNTGRKGEELVADYLERLKFQKRIEAFNWMNRSQESGLPYDFTIQYPNQNIVYVDAKSTLYRFEQPMVFSGSELQFICQTPYYHIFRVYDLAESECHLKVCENSNGYVPCLCDCINIFKSEIQRYKADLHGIKIQIPPTLEDLRFSQQITL